MLDKLSKILDERDASDIKYRKIMLNMFDLIEIFCLKYKNYRF